MFGSKFAYINHDEEEDEELEINQNAPSSILQPQLQQQYFSPPKQTLQQLQDLHQRLSQQLAQQHTSPQQKQQLHLQLKQLKQQIFQLQLQTPVDQNSRLPLQQPNNVLQQQALTAAQLDQKQLQKQQEFASPTGVTISNNVVAQPGQTQLTPQQQQQQLAIQKQQQQQLYLLQQQLAAAQQRMAAAAAAGTTPPAINNNPQTPTISITPITTTQAPSIHQQISQSFVSQQNGGVSTPPITSQQPQVQTPQQHPTQQQQQSVPNTDQKPVVDIQAKVQNHFNALALAYRNAKIEKTTLMEHLVMLFGNCNAMNYAKKIYVIPTEKVPALPKDFDLETILKHTNDLCQMIQYIKTAKTQQQQAAYKAKVKKANTNVLVVNLGSVAKESSIQTGDVNFCKQCKCGFSNINDFKEILLSDGTKQSSVPTNGGFNSSTKIWTCEFCNHENSVLLDKEEVPNTNIIDYILESEPIGDVNNNNNNNNTGVEKEKDEKEKDEKEKNQSDNSMVIFCIDISGSMELTQSVINLQLPSSIAPNSDGKSMTHVNYITRLQCVQIGLLDQIETISKKYPNKRVGIVTFSTSVNIIGDGTKPTIKIDDSKLNDLSSLYEEGSSYSLGESITSSKGSLIDNITKLRGNGSTALGSAVAVCIGLANGSTGSQIIVCTDGESNIGLGVVREGNTYSLDPKIFEQMGNMAQRSGSTISILTIKGTNTNLNVISNVANVTGGQVNIVDPLQLKDGFKEVINLPTLATNVSIRLFLHNGMYISDDGKRTENSFHERTIGNVNQDTTVSFEYGVKSAKLIDSSLKSIPFQLQIYYTTLTGKKCVRIITQTLEVTNKSQIAEDHANVDVLGLNMVQQSSRIATTGDYERSRAKNLVNANYMQKVMQQQQQQQPMQPMHIQQQQQQQQQVAFNYLQQAQSLETQLANTVSKESSDSKNKSKSERKKSRVSKRDDTTANMLFNMNNMNNNKQSNNYI